MRIDVVREKIEENLRQSAKALDLSGADITELPFELSKLNHLCRLTINNSRIKRLDARIFSHLSKLTHFSATNCDLVTFPDGLRTARSLREVDCSDNGIFSITPEIAQMSVLRTLDGGGGGREGGGRGWGGEGGGGGGGGPGGGGRGGGGTGEGGGEAGGCWPEPRRRGAGEGGGGGGGRGDRGGGGGVGGFR